MWQIGDFYRRTTTVQRTAGSLEKLRPFLFTLTTGPKKEPNERRSFAKTSGSDNQESDGIRMNSASPQQGFDVGRPVPHLPFTGHAAATLSLSSPLSNLKMAWAILLRLLLA